MSHEEVLNAFDNHIRTLIKETGDMPHTMTLSKKEYNQLIRAINAVPAARELSAKSNLRGMYYRGILVRPSSPYTEGFVFKAVG